MLDRVMALSRHQRGSLQEERFSCTTRDMGTGSVWGWWCCVFHCGLLTPAKINGRLCQNDGFGLCHRLQIITENAIPDLVSLCLCLIIYHGRRTPVAALSRKMAFGLPNFLSWVFVIFLPFKAQSHGTTGAHVFKMRQKP